MERYYSLKEAARITGWAYRTLWHKCKYREIEFSRMMEKYAFTESQLVAIMRYKNTAKK